MASRTHRFTAKEHRQVEHIAESERKRGHSAAQAEQIGYATVNKAVEGDPIRRYSEKERRQARHIIASEEERGKSEGEAKSIAYATVNKLANAKPKATSKSSR